MRQDIEEFPEGFATVIGERGVTLSGGQKQRSTLARALIRLPKILILDDALSAVDTHTEEAILGHLREIMRDRTTIIIAHRVSTLRDADHTGTAKRLATPTLCLVGDQDGSTPPDLVRACADLIPGSRFEIIEDAGHLPCIEQPAATARLLRDFADEIFAAGPAR